MVDALNSLVTWCLNRHAPLKKVKLTRPPAPWMASDEIRELQTTRDKLRTQARCSGTDETWTSFRVVRNRIKAVIGKAKRAFPSTALSSKRPKEVWRVIHRVIHPNPRPIRADSDQLNRNFIRTTDSTRVRYQTRPSI